MNINQDILLKAKAIKLIILDVDGVLTDGKIWLSPDGTEYKSFNCQDGLGLKRLQQLTAIEIAIISGRKSETVQLRLEQLGIKHIYLGYPNKLPVYNKIKAHFDLENHQVCYTGDDLPDLDVMQQVGLPITVNNAFHAMKQHAAIITRQNGGDGAVREICELLIKAQQE